MLTVAGLARQVPTPYEGLSTSGPLRCSGAASSYRSNFRNWVENSKQGREPTLTYGLRIRASKAPVYTRRVLVGG